MCPYPPNSTQADGATASPPSQHRGLRSRGVTWTALALLAAIIGAFVVHWGLGLPAEFRQASLLGVPFFAFAFVSRHLARGVRPLGTDAAAGRRHA